MNDKSINGGANLFEVDATQWQLGGIGAPAPSIEATDIVAPNGTSTALRVRFPKMSERSSYSLIFRCPAQSLNTWHRFKVYLRGQIGDEKVWLSHSPNPVRFTQQVCKLSLEWEQFVLDYRTSDNGGQYVHIGVDLRDSEQVPSADQTIFVWGEDLIQTEETPSRLVLTGRQSHRDAIAIYEMTATEGVWRVKGNRRMKGPLSGRLGEPLSQDLLAAWSPKSMITIKPDLAIVEVQGEHGRQGAWAFDAKLRLQAQGMRPEADPQGNIYSGGREARTVAKALGSAFVALLADAGAANQIQLLRVFLGLQLVTRCDVMLLGWSAVEPPGALPRPPSFTVTSTEDEARLDNILSLNWLDVTAGALDSGKVSVPALTHAGQAFSVRIIVTNAYQAAIQVRDTPDSDTWIILLDAFTLQHRYYKETIQAIVFPRDWTFVPGHIHDPRAVHQLLGVALFRLVQLGEHAARWASNPTEIAILGRPPYWQSMSHQIWNTNSTLLRAIEAAEQRSVAPPDYWDIAAAAGIEVFGPIEDFFPELTGRVRRSAQSAEGAFLEAARQGQTLLFDVFHEVPTRLRARMRRAVARDPNVQAAFRKSYTSLMHDKSERPPVVIFGLRLQSRTVPQLLEFYVHAAERLAENGAFIAVLDGLTTSAGGTVFKTYSVPADDNDLLAQERSFEARFRERVAGLPIKVMSLIGLPIREALLWLGFGDMFIGPHGTGMTKLRWLHNVPGLILVGDQNRRFGHALRIYEADGNVEDPSELIYPEPDEVKDLLPPNHHLGPDGRLHDPWWLGLINYNFEIVNEPSLLQHVIELFDRRMASQPRPGDTWHAELRAAGRSLSNESRQIDLFADQP